MLDDPGVVPCRKGVCAGAVRERQQPGEAKATVAMDARVGCLAALVAAHERLDHGAPKLVAQVERHVRHAKRVTGRASREDRIGRAASTLSVGPSGSSQRRKVTPIAFGSDLSNVTALSTPPLIATAMRPAARGARKTGPIALASASTASVSPPTEAASNNVSPTSERSSPEASASTMRSPSNPSRTSANSGPRAESPMSSITNSG